MLRGVSDGHLHGHATARAGARHQRPLLIAFVLILGFLVVQVMVGIVTGSLLAKAMWGTFWSWEPVQILSVLAWLLYALLLQTRSAGWRGRRAATLTLFGFALLVVSFLSLNLGFSHAGSFG